jgi:hypothetical protein
MLSRSKSVVGTRYEENEYNDPNDDDSRGIGVYGD